MTENQEHRYRCKICNKICESPQSLGGHMRAHLSKIPASKKAAKVKKSEMKMEFEAEDDLENGILRLKYSGNQSNSSNLSENIVGSVEDDSNNSYELKDTKSWRISDSGIGESKKKISCKECGKKFSSSKALAGHMRSHSIKNRESNRCEECGEGFKSTSVLCGHMKSHTKRSRVPDDPREILSGLVKFCPIQKKRSILRYSSSESREVEDAAESLMMLSMG